MNVTLLRKARRILAADNLSAGDERAVLTRAFALAWARAVTGYSIQKTETVLSSFLPQRRPAVSAESDRQLNALLSGAPAGEEGQKNVFTPAIIALVHEYTSDQARADGIFYTPWNTARRLAEQTLEGWMHTHPHTKRPPSVFTVCDPAAGAGGLLIPLWLEWTERLRRAGENRPEAVLLETCAAQLYAGDLEQSALQALRLRAALTFLARSGQKPPETLFSHTMAGDALAGDRISVWRVKFPCVFENGGFDAIICNPPYIGQKNHKTLFERLRNTPRWKPYISPKGDLLYLFFHLALDLLKPGGTGGFLTTAYFAQAASADGLRARLKTETAFLRLLDFRTERLFVRAPGQHNLISVFQKTADKTVLCRVDNQTVSQADLYSGPTHFLNISAQDGLTASLLRKMDAALLRLKDVARVSNGLMTGCDKISSAHLRRHPLPGIQKGEGVFVLSQKQKDALHLSRAEEKKLKPFFKNSDISSYTASTVPKYWLIDFFYPKDRETDFSAFPRLLAHLARFKPVLLARKQNNNGIDKQLKKGVYWFASVRRKMNFDAEKLAAPQRARTNTFAFAPGPWYASSDVYFVSAPKPGFSLWYLLALLNSAPYYVWLFYKGKRKGSLLELYSQPLAELPIPRAKAEQQKELETLAREIYRIKSSRPDADVRPLQARINCLVGALFGLTIDEIKHAESQRAANSHTP